MWAALLIDQFGRVGFCFGLFGLLYGAARR